MKRSSIQIAFMALFLTFSCPAFSASIYVSPTGLGEACTQYSPCSLTTGLSLPHPGDEVILLDGTYSESLMVVNGGAPGQPVTVRAANKWQATVLMPDGILGRVWANYVNLEGVVFDGASTGGHKGGVRVGAGDEVILPEPVHDVVLDSLVVRDVRAAAISITSGEHDVTVRNCYLLRSGRQEFWGEGFYLGNKYDETKTVYNLDIYANTVLGFTQNGLEAKKWSHDFRVHDNYFTLQVPWRIYGGDPGADNEGTITLDGHSHQVFNNRLWGNDCGMAAFVVEPEADHRVFNNVVFDGTGRGDFAVRMKSWSKTWAPGQYPPSAVFNNTFYGLPNHSVGDLDPSILIVKNNIGLDLDGNLSSYETAPALFMDPQHGDFRLAPGSRAIDLANSEPFSPTDANQQAITGACRDFGAYEYTGGSPHPPAPGPTNPPANPPPGQPGPGQPGPNPPGHKPPSPPIHGGL